MTKINKIQTNQQASADVNNVQGQRAFQSQEADKAEFTGMSKKKKVGLGVAIFALAATTLSLAYMIGRNPAKAAKALSGNQNIVNNAYKDGLKLAEEIMGKEGTFATSMDDVMNLFKKPAHRSNMSEGIERFEAYMKENGIAQDSDVGKALKRLKQNLKIHLDQSELNLAKGIENDSNRAKEFICANRADMETIYNELDWFKHSDLKDKFSPNFAESNLGLHDYIRECPAEILPNDGVLFHGTRHSKGLYKGGFTPYVSNQLANSSRELGAGVYTTPDPRVAASFSGLEGSIIPVKLGKDAKIALVSEDSHRFFNQQIAKFTDERISKEAYENLSPEVRNAMHECLMKKIMQQAGYDAAFIPKGVKGGGLFANLLTPNINEVIGKNQSQVVVFTPEKLTIVPRTLKERISDLKLKFDGVKAQIKWQREHPFGF